MVYRNNDKVVYRKLHEDEYHEIFEHFKPRVNYSIPDRLIQDFDKRNQFLPLYKESNNYSRGFEESVRRGNELQYIENTISSEQCRKNQEKNKKKRQNRRKIPSRTMKKRQMTLVVRCVKIEKKINKKSTKTKKNHVKKTSK